MAINRISKNFQEAYKQRNDTGSDHFASICSSARRVPSRLTRANSAYRPKSFFDPQRSFYTPVSRDDNFVRHLGTNAFAGIRCLFESRDFRTFSKDRRRIARRSRKGLVCRISTRKDERKTRPRAIFVHALEVRHNLIDKCRKRRLLLHALVPVRLEERTVAKRTKRVIWNDAKAKRLKQSSGRPLQWSYVVSRNRRDH